MTMATSDTRKPLKGIRLFFRNGTVPTVIKELLGFERPPLILMVGDNTLGDECNPNPADYPSLIETYTGIPTINAFRYWGSIHETTKVLQSYLKKIRPTQVVVCVGRSEQIVQVVDDRDRRAIREIQGNIMEMADMIVSCGAEAIFLAVPHYVKKFGFIFNIGEDWKKLYRNIEGIAGVRVVYGLLASVGNNPKYVGEEGYILTREGIQYIADHTRIWK